VSEVRELGRGNIHQTYRVILAGNYAKDFVLQRVNTRIFRSPEHVMCNIRTVTTHVHDRLLTSPFSDRPDWRLPLVIPAETGQDLWTEPDGEVWRAMEYIPGARTLNVLGNPEEGYEVGIALGTFHRLVTDISAERLFDTLPGFHVTPFYLAHYDRVEASCGMTERPEIRHARGFIRDRRDGTDVLESALREGRLSRCVIHGDPKYDNILLDAETGRALAMVDLDTVKPGLLHYDIGDCLRSGCNRLGEDLRSWEEARFDTEMARAIFKGYLLRMGSELSSGDLACLYEAVRLITFELGLRFFTDYLEGNVYFKTTHPEENLYKALVQFQLTASIEKQEEEIRSLPQEHA